MKLLKTLGRIAARPWQRNRAGVLGLLAVLLVSATLVRAEIGRALLLNLTPFLDPTGIVSTYNENGNIDLNGPFFQSRDC
jgi:hypothetical protein